MTGGAYIRRADLCHAGGTGDSFIYCMPMRGRGARESFLGLRNTVLRSLGRDFILGLVDAVLLTHRKCLLH